MWVNLKTLVWDVYDEPASTTLSRNFYLFRALKGFRVHQNMTNRPGGTLIVIFLKCKGFFFFSFGLQVATLIGPSQKNPKYSALPQSWSIELLPFGTPLNRIWKFNFGSKNWDKVWCYESSTTLGPKTMVIYWKHLGNHHWDPMGTWLVGNTKIPKKLNPHRITRGKKIGLFSLNFFHLV